MKPYVLTVLFCLSLWLIPAGTPAENSTNALEQLLRLIEQKGVISEPEADLIRHSLHEEQRQQETQRRQLEEREKLLLQREQALQQRLDELRRSSTDAPLPTATDRPEASADSTATPAPSRLCLYTPGHQGLSFCPQVMLQTDYRWFNFDDDPGVNGFDIRRARLGAAGNYTPWLAYQMLLEFEGAGSRRLLDAYLDVHIRPYLSLRAGQFKLPFSLQQSTPDAHAFFAEKSMGNYISPQRDVGVMLHGHLADDRVGYGLSLSSGDGPDDSSAGDNDSPDVTGRLVLRPWANQGISWVDNLHLGLSGAYSRIDQTNISLNVKTAGLTPFFQVTSMAKFNVIREAQSRTRSGAELGWAFGPVVLQAEYLELRYNNVKTSAHQFDVKITDYYCALAWILAGEKPRYSQGILQPIIPHRSITEGGLGAWALAVRHNVFEAEQSVYDNLITDGISVRKATSWSLALNWYWNAHARLLLEASRTDFDQPLLIRRDPLTGTAIFNDREDVLISRLQFDF